MEVRLAIVGGGASCVAFIYSLEKILKKFDIYSRLIIDIYEPGEEIGRGLAYLQDPDFIRLNRPPEDMSIDYNNSKHFLNWIETDPYRIKKFKESEFLSRNIFGDYLNSVFKNTSDSIKFLGHEINHIKETVQVINKISDEDYKLITSENSTMVYNYVILAVGGHVDTNIYGLSKQKAFVSKPYPLNKNLKDIKCNKKIGIIGSSLTAIDCFLFLKQKGCKNVTMISRSGKLPSVRGQDTPYNLTIFTKENLKSRATISINELLELFLKEFDTKKISWRALFFKKRRTDYENFREEIQSSIKDNTWFDILRETHPILDEVWNKIDNKEKHNFVENLLPIYIPRRAAIPLVNAQQILESLKNNELKILGGINNISYLDNKFYVSFSNSHEKQEFDLLINATGVTKDISQNPLIAQMLKEGLVKNHIAGGIDVNFKTCSVISENNMENPYIRSIGYITSGNYFVVNNLEFIRKKANDLAEDLIMHIKSHIMQLI